MPRWLQITLHIASAAAGAYLAYTTGQPLPLVISAGLQTAIGAVSQAYNTDGTHQTTAFIPKGETK